MRAVQHLQQKWWRFIFFSFFLWNFLETFCFFQWSLTKNMEWIHKNGPWQINYWVASVSAVWFKMWLQCPLHCSIVSIIHSWLLYVSKHFFFVGLLRSLTIWVLVKVVYSMYCNHWPLNHGLNHVSFLSLFKLMLCPIHWIMCVLAYSNFVFQFQSIFCTVQNDPLSPDTEKKSVSFIWIVWRTLYVYLWF